MRRIDMNPEKLIYAVIISIVVLSVAQALYPTLSDYITNITGAGYGGTAILAVVATLYWVLISAGVVLFWVKSFGIHMGGRNR